MRNIILAILLFTSVTAIYQLTILHNELMKVKKDMMMFKERLDLTHETIYNERHLKIAAEEFWRAGYKR